MQFNLVNVLVFLTVGAFFIGATLLVGRLVRPNTPDQEKSSTYECAERPIAQAWFNFNPRFYIIAIIFLIFDVEIAFTYPVATVFRRWVATGAGLFAFLELLLFLVIVALGLAYVWAKGDLEWLKQIKASEGRGSTPLRRAAADAPGPAAASAAPAPAPDAPATAADAPATAAPGNA
ncbi:MAG: NADH-quinone oxidoreductase subunit A [Deltaproteobacteria bacterium]|nr:NADH-quinone oxidoreductase subunit A [Deltaproteobacteria bacterium]